MEIETISGTTRVVGASQGYNGLPIRDEVVVCTVNGPVNAMVSAWSPTPEELERLNAGANVELSVLGTVPPPVLLQVGEAPAETINKADLIEQWAQEEYRDGVSPGAAARELCRLLGAYGMAPTLRGLLEDMISSANRAAFDRRMILAAFSRAAPEAADQARQESFRRINRTGEERKPDAWAVTRLRPDQGPNAWELDGIYLDKDQALAACIDDQTVAVRFELDKDYREIDEFEIARPEGKL